MSDENKKPATVSIHNSLGRALMLHLHQIIEDDGGGRSFQGRMLGDIAPITLTAGHNQGIDKEFWDRWVKENHSSSLLPHLISQDEKQPEQESDDGSRRDVDARQETDEVQGRLSDGVGHDGAATTSHS